MEIYKLFLIIFFKYYTYLTDAFYFVAVRVFEWKTFDSNICCVRVRVCERIYIRLKSLMREIAIKQSPAWQS